ncbi:MAG TPA: hypothetical protein PKN48_00345 [Bacteroidales bacterium]|nr:hypothetical protein [Bacteroidales bacterium]
MKELSRVLAFAVLAAVANVVAIWATAKVQEETMTTKTAILATST